MLYTQQNSSRSVFDPPAAEAEIRDAKHIERKKRAQLGKLVVPLRRGSAREAK